MKKERTRPLALLTVYSVLMLSIMGCTVFGLTWQLSKAKNTAKDPPTVTEKYVYVYADPKEEDETSDIKEETWVVREHEQRIAIFSGDGRLLEELEIHTNTLPRADRSLLREGITVTSRSELYALIEDYSE